MTRTAKLANNNMKKNIEQLTEDVVAIFKEYDKQGTKPWDYKIAALDLQYQIGSLSKRISQLEGTRYNDGLQKDEIMPLIADELADIVAEVLFIANDLKLDMSVAWENMLANDKSKIASRSKNSSSI